MTHIVELPVTYLVEGALRGKRKPLLHRIVELVPFAIEEMDPTDEIVRVGRYEPMIAQGRPWIPVAHLHAEGMTLQDVAAFGEGFARGRGVASASDPSSLLGRPHRNVRTDQPTIEVPRGRDWRDPFARIARTDRPDAVAMSQAVAAHLRVVDGRLRTDRYEPLLRTSPGIYGPADDIDRDKEYQSFFDLVTQTACIAKSDGNGEYHGLPLRILPYDWHSVGEPVRAPWARDVVWEADRFLLVALEFANRMQVSVSNNTGHRYSALDALSSEGVSAIYGMARWARERRDGLLPPMTRERFERAMRDIRRAATSPDAYGAEELPSRLLRDLDFVEVDLAILDEVEPLADEDLTALCAPVACVGDLDVPPCPAARIPSMGTPGP